MKLGSLFSGIGGFDVGLERAGMSVVWQCEIDPKARQVLEHHWPKVARFEDVRSIDGSAARVDVVAGGFPCQDLSSANTRRRVGLEGKRSGLWSEFNRVVQALKPRWVIVENVGHTWRDWLPKVRSDLARGGYASLPLALSTAELGAPHHRDRVFVLANSDSDRKCVLAVNAATSEVRTAAGRSGPSIWRACAAALARVDGIPRGLARLPGNAVATYVAEVIGRAVMGAQ